MSNTKATLAQGALIVGAFVVLALAVAGYVESKQPESGGHGSQESVSSLIAVNVEKTPAMPLEMMTQKPHSGVKQRTLRDFYALRAYPGAPPMIPHEVKNDGVIADNCNSCHKDGGYAPEYNAYSPVSPHPEKSNCRQCHVPVVREELFVATEWFKAPPPKRGRAMLPGSPPPTPHSLHLRTNCQACHVGPAAVKEIRASHPERESCEQCHVPSYTNTRFLTPYPVGGNSDPQK